MGRYDDMDEGELELRMEGTGRNPLEHLAVLFTLCGFAGGKMLPSMYDAVSLVLTRFGADPAAATQLTERAVGEVSRIISTNPSEAQLSLFVEHHAERAARGRLDMREAVEMSVFLAEHVLAPTLLVALHTSKSLGFTDLESAIYNRSCQPRLNPIVILPDGSQSVGRAVHIDQVSETVDELEAEGASVEELYGVWSLSGESFEVRIQGARTLAFGPRMWQGLVNGQTVEMDPDLDAVVAALNAYFDLV